jgi:hypothetical protein
VAGRTATAVRLSWPAAPSRVRYAVAVDGRVIGTTTATRVRVIGLRPGTAYAMRVSLAGADGALTAHTASATVRTTAAARPAAGGWLQLGNALTGAVAQLSGSRGADGTPLVLGAADGAADQQWQLRAAGGGRFLLRSRATGKCVAPLGPAQPGAVLTQRACSAQDPAQRWRVVRDDHGYALTAGSSPLVVGVSRCGSAASGCSCSSAPARPATRAGSRPADPPPPTHPARFSRVDQGVCSADTGVSSRQTP